MCVHMRKDQARASRLTVEQEDSAPLKGAKGQEIGYNDLGVSSLPVPS